LRVDRLNRLLEDSKKQNGDGDETQGPLENLKLAISKNIEDLDDEITQA
jgi:hypothetical protein